MIAYPHREDVTGGSVQHAVGCRSQQQRKSVATVAANDDDVRAVCLRGTLYLTFGPPENQVLALGGNLQRRSKFGQM